MPGCARRGWPRREEIDALNVYPVPDGDTGTNLYLTLESATEAAERAHRENAALGPVLAAIARGALLGARGNSGVILAQMFRAGPTHSAPRIHRGQRPCSPRP